MVGKYQPITILGIVVALIITLTSLSALIALFVYASPIRLEELFSNSYWLKVIRFTIFQAIISTILCIVPAIFIAQALSRRYFFGKHFLLKCCALVFTIPTLVTVLGIISIFGRQGWMAELFKYFDIPYQLPLYGLFGILFAHVFYNLPFAIHLFFQTLQSIPQEQRLLSKHLGLTYWQNWILIEYPALKKQLVSISFLIFMLCFTSFSIVLILGGGPKYTTIELAIYNAIRNFDLHEAAFLSIIQLIFCLVIILWIHKTDNTQPIKTIRSIHLTRITYKSFLLKVIDSTFIAILMLILFPILISIIIDALRFISISYWYDAKFWQATLTSILIAIIVGFFANVITLILLLAKQQTKRIKWINYLPISGFLILAIPIMVLTTGLFIIANKTVGIPEQPYILIVFMNILITLPFCLKILANPLENLYQRYELLIQSIGFTSWNRFRWIELIALKKQILFSFSFACVLSLGDFGVVSLLGKDDFLTLPFYLYQQIGFYRNHDASVTAGILLFINFIFFSIHHNND